MKDWPLQSDPPDAVPTVLFDRLLDAVCPILNEVHSVEQSSRFWAILLYRYFLKCIVASRVANDLRGANGVFADADDVVLGAWPTRPELSPVRHAAAKPWLLRGAAAARSIPRRLRRHILLREMGGRSAADTRSMFGGFHDVDVIARWVAGPAGWWTAAVGDHATTNDVYKRRRLEQTAASVDCPLTRLALACLPSSYVEEFSGRIARVNVESAAKKTIHAAFLADVQSRFVVARYVAAGARLHFYQHGCDYGEIEGFGQYHAESSIADQFFTWGWRLRETDVPFVALRFMRPARDGIRLRRPTATWLYVIQRRPLPWNLDVTRDVQERFFGALNPRVARACVLRPRSGWVGELSDRVRPIVGEIADWTAPINEDLGSVGLAVFDGFPSTSFLECLQAGFPVIAIEAENVPFTAIAQPFYEEFFRLGLLHREPEAAARFLNGLSVDVWWEMVRQSRCVKDYLEIFCCGSRDRLRRARS